MRSFCFPLTAVVFWSLVGLKGSQAQDVIKPKIEVASIKQNKSASRDSSTNTNRGSLTATNVTVRSLILFGYNISDFQLVGAPDWLSRDTFDIQAKSDADPNAKPNPRGLLQALLEDRFQLNVHTESRELPALLLTVEKGGLKMPSTREGPVGPDGLEPGGSSVREGPTGIEIKGRGLGMPEFTRKISPYAGRLIIDRTNLSGAFDFTLRFSRLPESTSPPTNPSSEVAPDIFTAFREQLGLRLNAGRGPVEVLVIDSVQKPRPN
jgi:uncharacterized protein (TIGR03435 family)